MLEVGNQIQYFVCTRPVDMRNGFDGLAGIVRNFMRKTPTSGAAFIFFNKNRTHLKLLFWDSDGFVLYYKRLERGRFQRCTADNATSLEVDKITLNLLRYASPTLQHSENDGTFARLSAS